VEDHDILFSYLLFFANLTVILFFIIILLTSVFVIVSPWIKVHKVLRRNPNSLRASNSRSSI
jgi:hypothetical protein